jgi:putative copper resistance protein D
MEGVIAHGGIPGPFSAGRLFTGWTFQPIPIALMALTAVLYWRGLRRLSHGPAWPRGRVWAFAGGVAGTAVALVSPVDTYSSVSFSDHMVQHVLLMFVAAPLFALSAPVTLALRAASPRTRKRVLLPILHSPPVAVLTNPLVAAVLFVGVQFVTHLTGFYEAALRSAAVHDLEHVLYLGIALMFWWPVAGLDPAPRKLSHPARLLYLVATMPAEAFLSLALLNAKPYPHYVSLPPPWGGAAAVADQSSAAAIMWIVGDLTTLIAALLVAGAWLRHDQVRQRRIEEDEDRLSRSGGPLASPTRVPPRASYPPEPPVTGSG